MQFLAVSLWLTFFFVVDGAGFGGGVEFLCDFFLLLFEGSGGFGGGVEFLCEFFLFSLKGGVLVWWWC